MVASREVHERDVTVMPCTNESMGIIVPEPSRCLGAWCRMCSQKRGAKRYRACESEDRTPHVRTWVGFTVHARLHIQHGEAIEGSVLPNNPLPPPRLFSAFSLPGQRGRIGPRSWSRTASETPCTHLDILWKSYVVQWYSRCTVMYRLIQTYWV
jgi:hypothetical protein